MLVYAFIFIVTFPIFLFIGVQIRKLFLTTSAMQNADVATICPKCRRQVKLRYFLCPNCGETNDLAPNENAIYYETCSCGRKLPKTLANGRAQLNAVCPYCRFVLGRGFGTFQEIVVPIVGGPSTGKSAFLSAWISFASRALPRKLRAKIEFPSSSDVRFAKQAIQNWENGRRPKKTSELVPNGFAMDIKRAPKRRDVRLYCYDPAGESFDDVRNLREFIYYDYMDGVIFLVDPFSIPAIRSEYEEELRNSDQNGFQYADRDANDCCDRLINSLRTFHHLGADEYHFAFCAVVFTKIDMFDLDRRLGMEAAREIQRTSPEKLSDGEALHLACVQFLERVGCGDLLDKLNDHFKETRCFSISSFGHMPDEGTEYAPVRVEEPFLWILRRAEKNGRKKGFFARFKKSSRS